MKKYVFIIIALVVVLGGVAFISYYLSNKPLEIEAWESYRNEEHGFEMNYPKNWYVSPSSYQETDRIIFSNLPDGNIAFKDDLKRFEKVHILIIRIMDMKIDDWLEEHQKSCKAFGLDCFQEKITIGKNEAYKIGGTIEEGKKGFSKLLFKGEKVYLAETLSPKNCGTEECEVFDEILSTFRFLE
ncbi:unnamed protein product [marine sediment metagenome]|uniref:PsbP C-terminal domain-containing protein n=1 Tax=marine sediment metagenome TaxID=412755 RepID=X0UJW7_9ZZZZ